ncbi:MAG: class II glutamine amidotransferase [Thermoleophilia bacterium]|nr:class II glutamine amidotransferase [Thermoleophilia bacterium]
MCRIAAYLGPPIPLSTLLMDPGRSLLIQSRDAREMADGRVAGDGWGVGWFPDAAADPGPGMIKSILPLWSDENAKTAAHAIASRCVVGHVRFAAPTIETCFTNTPLYPMEGHLWTVNGELSPWPGPLSKALRDRLDPRDEAAIRGSTDAEMLGALWCTRRRESPAGDAASALRAVLAEAHALAAEHDGSVKMNVIVAAGDEVVACRYADAGEPNSLYVLSGEPRWHWGGIVASEPLDEGPGWRVVPPSSLVRIDAEGAVRVEPLALHRRRRLQGNHR